jgi:hypothetical protein
MKGGGVDEQIARDKRRPEATESLRGVAAKESLGQVAH